MDTPSLLASSDLKLTTDACFLRGIFELTVLLTPDFESFYLRLVSGYGSVSDLRSFRLLGFREEP